MKTRANSDVSVLQSYLLSDIGSETPVPRGFQRQSKNRYQTLRAILSFLLLPPSSLALPQSHTAILRQFGCGPFLPGSPNSAEIFDRTENCSMHDKHKPAASFPEFVNSSESHSPLPETVVDFAALNRYTSQFPAEAKALPPAEPLGWIFDPDKNPNDPGNRVIGKRIWEQAHEPRPDLRYDIGLDIAALIRFYRGDFPTFWECYQAMFARCLGVSQEKFAAQFEERRRQRCGTLYDEMFPAAASAEKKRPQSFPSEHGEKAQGLK